MCSVLDYVCVRYATNAVQKYIVPSVLVVYYYGWMDGWMDGWMNGWMDGRMDGWMDGWMVCYNHFRLNVVSRGSAGYECVRYATNVVHCIVKCIYVVPLAVVLGQLW